jgi:hypothetical protein
MRATPSDLEEDLDRLDVGIRQLKIQYDMFQAGALEREPLELRARVEALIKKHANRPVAKYALRFRFNALVGRFNVLSELWGKRVRSMEEGEHRSLGFAERAGLRERLLARCHISRLTPDSPDLVRLHRRFVEAQRRAGKPEARLPSFEAFVRGVANQTRRLREETGCDSIELRLIESDETVQLKARPGREPGAAASGGEGSSQ